jgi:uncharacterized protein (TIGR03083 family)
MRPTDAPTVPELIDVWEATLLEPVTLCADLTDAQWHAPSLCPGWEVADVVAHMADIDGMLAGLPRPDHEPDWDRLPHVANEVGRFTEIAVDAARGSDPADLLARLREVAAVRRAQLDALPVDAEVLSPFGRPTTLERLVRMRTFDLWAHTQDVRAGIGADGGWGSDGAVVSFQQISRSLMVVWSSLDAPAGAVVHLVVTGPGIEADVWASTDGAGRGAVSGPVPDPAVELELSWPDYALLSCGRITADETRAPVVMRGDADLGGRLVAELAITP